MVISQVVEGDIEKELSGEMQCKVCEKSFLQAEMETHLRFSHGVVPAKKGHGGNQEWDPDCFTVLFFKTFWRYRVTMVLGNKLSFTSS